MKTLLAASLFLAACLPATAASMSSEYTDLDIGRDCSVFSANEEGGEFANFVCPGWRGYPVLVHSADLRESLFYGFPPANDVWESFDGFNAVGPKIEWRLETHDGRTVPIATIHRWRVDDGTGKNVEILVVEKVGQVDEREGCAIGLVMATGNPAANEMARRIADEQARDFACGADERVLVGDQIPSFSRTEE